MTNLETEYRRSLKHEWNTISNLDITQLKRSEYRVYSKPFTLLAALALIAALALPGPAVIGVLIAIILIAIAGSIGPKRTRLSLITNQGQTVPVLDSNDKAEIDEVYSDVHYLVFHRFPRTEYISEFDEMVKRIQSEGSAAKKMKDR